MQRHEIFNLLREQSADMEFVKANGSTKRIVASLEDQYIGPWKSETLAQMREGGDTLRVFSVTDNEWRTVIVKNVNYCRPVAQAA